MGITVADFQCQKTKSAVSFIAVSEWSPNFFSRNITSLGQIWKKKIIWQLTGFQQREWWRWLPVRQQINNPDERWWSPKLDSGNGNKKEETDERWCEKVEFTGYSKSFKRQAEGETWVTEIMSLTERRHLPERAYRWNDYFFLE